MQQVLDLDSTLKKYPFAHLEDVYFNKLSPRAKKQFDEIFEQLKSKEMHAFQRNHKLGVIEESSDMLFELYTMRALRDNIITDPQVNQWINKFLPPHNQKKRQEKDFSSFLREIGQQLSPEKVNGFQKMVGWDSEKSRNLLSLIAAKFVLMRARAERNGKKYNIWKDNKNLLDGEATELKEELRGSPVGRLKITLLTLAYKYIPFLPVNFFKRTLLSTIQKHLKQDATYSDLMENVYQKQFRRQEFDYYNPQLETKEKRKGYLKGLERVHEGAIFKNVLLFHPYHYVND